MVKKEIIIITDYSQSTLTLDELWENYRISTDFINALIEYDIIHPKQMDPNEWTFDLIEFQRIQKAMRLQRDLEVNVAGIAVVLGLLDELEELRERMKLLEKHYL